MKKISVILIALCPLFSYAQLGNLLGELKKLSPPASTSPATPAPSSAATTTPTTPSRTAVSTSDITASPEPKNAVATLNLKGFNLKMSKDEVRKIIPNIEANDLHLVDGKKRTDLSCGALFSKSKTSCSFTYAGMDIVGVVASFWGEELTVFQLVYNTGPRAQVDRNEFKLGAIMKEALVSKFGPPINDSQSYSGRWVFGYQKMFQELEEDDKAGLYGAVAVSNSPLISKYQSSLERQNQEESKKGEAARKKKTLSDM